MPLFAQVYHPPPGPNDKSATFEAPAAEPVGYTFLVFLVSEAVFILVLDINVRRRKKKRRKPKPKPQEPG